MASYKGPRLGWIGLGSMGLGMATNLQKHLSKLSAPPLQYSNRTMSRGAPLEQLGGIPCPKMDDFLRAVDIVFMSLSDDEAVKTTVEAIVSTSIACSGHDLVGKIFVDTSTVHPKTSASAEVKLGYRGAQFVAAPVFGASPVAVQGQLLFVVAGPDDAIEAISSFLVPVMGRSVIRLGDDVKQAGMLKTAGNFITAGMMEIVAEAHVFAEKTGLGSEAMESLIEEQYGPLALSMSKRLTTGAYVPSRGERPMSDLNLALKDVGHGISIAEQAGTRLEVGKVALDHLEQAKLWADSEDRALDSSSMYGIIREQARLPFETKTVKQRDASR